MYESSQNPYAHNLKLLWIYRRTMEPKSTNEFSTTILQLSPAFPTVNTHVIAITTKLFWINGSWLDKSSIGNLLIFIPSFCFTSYKTKKVSQ